MHWLNYTIKIYQSWKSLELTFNVHSLFDFNECYYYKTQVCQVCWISSWACNSKYLQITICDTVANHTISTSVWTRLFLSSQKGKNLSVVKYMLFSLFSKKLYCIFLPVILSYKWRGVLFYILSLNLSALVKLSY